MFVPFALSRHGASRVSAAKALTTRLRGHTLHKQQEPVNLDLQLCRRKREKSIRGTVFRGVARGAS